MSCRFYIKIILKILRATLFDDRGYLMRELSFIIYESSYYAKYISSFFIFSLYHSSVGKILGATLFGDRGYLMRIIILMR